LFPPVETQNFASLLLYAVVFYGGKAVTVEGEFEVLLLDQPGGKRGFVYDAVFSLRDMRMTMTELTPEQQNRLATGPTDPES